MACKVYVGDLDSGASKEDLEDVFSPYGRLHNVWVARNPPGFAFVEFEDNRDAEDAVRGVDGRSICGRRVRVEFSRGGRSRNRNRPPPRRGRPFHPESRCYQCGQSGHYARECFRNVRRGGGSGSGGGRSRYSRSRSRSRSPRRRNSRSRSRDRSRDRSRSRGRDRTTSRSRSRGRDRSASRSRSRSGSRSRSWDKNYDNHRSRTPEGKLGKSASPERSSPR